MHAAANPIREREHRHHQLLWMTRRYCLLQQLLKEALAATSDFEEESGAQPHAFQIRSRASHRNAAYLVLASHERQLVQLPADGVQQPGLIRCYGRRTAPLLL